MIFLYDSNQIIIEFKDFKDLKEYIDTRHAEEGGFDWISEIKDSDGNFYGCTWTLDIDRIS